MKKLNRFLYLLAFIKFLLPFFLQNVVYEPHRDEFLYLAEGRHLAFGYMEVPPLLSIFAWITQWMGNGFFWIKCWPSLLGALTFILAAKIIIPLGGRYFSVGMLFGGFIFSGFLRVHFLFQPNALEIFFYTVIAFGLVRYTQTSQNKWLYVTAAGIGLGMLSKYSIAFYVISLLPALIIERQRKIFLNKSFYIALGMAMLIILPNLIWQFVNHFPVIYHMHELTSTQLQYVPASSFLIDQFLMFLPCCFIWVTGFFYLMISKRTRPYRFLAWAYIGVILILLWFHGKSYYALGLYPVLLAFGSLAIEMWTVNKPRYFIRYLIGVMMTGLGLYFVMIMLPVLRPEPLAQYYRKTNAAGIGILRWEDLRDHQLPQDFADMLGWEEMAQKTSAAFKSLDSVQQSKTMIFCDNYGMAGAINFFRKKYDLPEAYSDNASFLYWLPEHPSFENLIVITGDTNEMQHAFIKQFAGASVFGSIQNPYAREKGSLIILLTGASSEFMQFFNKKINTDRLKSRGY